MKKKRRKGRKKKKEKRKKLDYITIGIIDISQYIEFYPMSSI